MPDLSLRDMLAELGPKPGHNCPFKTNEAIYAYLEKGAPELVVSPEDQETLRRMAYGPVAEVRLRNYDYPNHGWYPGRGAEVVGALDCSKRLAGASWSPSRP